MAQTIGNMPNIHVILNVIPAITIGKRKGERRKEGGGERKCSGGMKEGQNEGIVGQASSDSECIRTLKLAELKPVTTSSLVL